MFEGWSCDRNKNGMVMQEGRGIVQEAWLDLLSNEDLANRETRGEGRYILWYRAPCWSHVPPALMVEMEQPSLTPLFHFNDGKKKVVEAFQ